MGDVKENLLVSSSPKILRKKSGFHQLAYPRRKHSLTKFIPQFHLKTFKFLLFQYIPVTMKPSQYKIHNATNKTQNDNAKAF